MIKLTIDPSILFNLIQEFRLNKAYNGWMIVNKSLTGSDDEDGGGHYTIVLKELSTGKFYMNNYCDWDIDNTETDEMDDGYKVITDQEGGRCDLNCNLIEVIPKTKTITVYEEI